MTPADRGSRVFALFDFVLKVVWVGLVVMGLIVAAIAVSGVDTSRLDEHEVFRYRLHLAVAMTAGYLLLDHLLSRRRAARRQAAGVPNPGQPARDRTAELFALALLGAGGAAFWHDHITHEIPNPVAVAATFVSATCVQGSSRVAVVGPHMSIGYAFASQSTAVRVPQTTCLLEKCEPESPPPQPMDTEYKRVFYASVEQCRAALPDVLAQKAPTTVWTGDKDPNAAIRARFTPERDTPPYFLLWVPALVAAVVGVASALRRVRAKAREA